MANIGELVLKLGVGLGGLDSGLARAESKLKAFAGKTGKFLASPLSAAGAPGRVLGGLLSPIQSALGGVPFVGGALAGLAGGGGFLAHIEEQMGKMRETTLTARKLGISVEALSGLQYAAGGASEGLARGMFHLHKELGDAASGSVDAAFKFKRLGLDVNELLKLSPDEQFYKIADAVKGLSDPSEQAAGAFGVLGKTGFEMMPRLLKGGEGMRALAEDAKRLGLSMTELDATNVLRAGMALRQIKGTVEGIYQQAAINLAPYITLIADKFNEWAKNAGGVGPAVKGVFLEIAKVLAVLIDEIDDLLAAYTKLKSLETTKGKIEVVRDQIDPVRQAIRGYYEFFGDKNGGGPGAMTGKAGDSIRKIIEEMEKSAPPKPVGEGHLLPEADKELGEFIAHLQQHAEGIGKSADQVKLLEFAARGASRAMLDLAQNQLLKNQGLDLEQQVKAPVDKFNKALSDLDASALDDHDRFLGLLGLIDEQADKLGLNQPVKLAGVAEAGSAEAQSLVNRAGLEQSSRDPAAQLVRIWELLRQQGEARQREADALQRLMKERAVLLPGGL